MVVKITVLFTVCHFSGFIKLLPKEWPSKWRKNLAGPLGQMFTRYVGKITQYVDCVTKKLWVGAFPPHNNFGSNRRTYYLFYIVFYHSKFVFAEIILPSFCLIRICTRASKQYTIKNITGLPHMHLRFLLLSKTNFEW